jgi:hypothetical protein
MATDEAAIIADYWPDIVGLLPPDLETSARQFGALRRRRRIQCAADLLRIVMYYAWTDKSLRETAAWAQVHKIAELSDVAVLKRLRKASEWLGHLLVQLLQVQALGDRGPLPFQVRVVDATTVSQPGSTGTDWRVHARLDLASQRFECFELTGPRGGESLLRHALAPGEVALGDRGYGHPNGIARILDQQAHVVVRINWQNFPLQTRQGKPFDLLAALESLGAGEYGDWPVQFQGPTQTYAVRLVALCKADPQAVAKQQQRIRREAKRKGRTPDERSLRAAGYIFAITDLAQDELSAAQVLGLYRLRWQIEIAFKRLKGIIQLDHLRAKDPALAQAYLLAKLLAALLVGLLREAVAAIPPTADV